ncbi:hypothetical protein ABIB66_008762 [Bradyrhizobium sp. F1.13.3]
MSSLTLATFSSYAICLTRQEKELASHCAQPTDHAWCADTHRTFYRPPAAVRVWRGAEMATAPPGHDGQASRYRLLWLAWRAQRRRRRGQGLTVRTCDIGVPPRSGHSGWPLASPLCAQHKATCQWAGNAAIKGSGGMVDTIEPAGHYQRHLAAKQAHRRSGEGATPLASLVADAKNSFSRSRLILIGSRSPCEASKRTRSATSRADRCC